MEKINHQRELVGDSAILTSFFHHHYWDDNSQQYGDELLTKRPSVRRDIRSVMKHVWIPRFGSRNLNSLKTGELRGFLVSLVTTGQVSRQTAHKYKTYLSSLFSAAMRLETGVTHNPVRAVKLPSSGPENTRTRPALEEVVAIEQKLTDPRHRMIWKLLLWAGNRRGEIRGLRWRSVHWEQNCILVTESVWEGQSGQPKTKKGYRKIVLTTTQMLELKKYKDENYLCAGPDDWVFPGIHNRPVDLKRFMSTHVKPICNELGIRGVSLQALRHLNNSMMLSEGVDVKTRMDRLGHVSENTNMIYSHVGDEAQLAASEAIERRLEEARKELESKKAGLTAPPSLLSVTLSVTPNQPVPLTY
jgi:integrase